MYVNGIEDTAKKEFTLILIDMNAHHQRHLLSFECLDFSESTFNMPRLYFLFSFLIIIFAKLIQGTHESLVFGMWRDVDDSLTFVVAKGGQHNIKE